MGAGAGSEVGVTGKLKATGKLPLSFGVDGSSSLHVTKYHLRFIISIILPIITQINKQYFRVTQGSLVPVLYILGTSTL